jgi:hypothetical protein
MPQERDAQRHDTTTALDHAFLACHTLLPLVLHSNR